MEYYDKNPTGMIQPVEPETTDTDRAALKALDEALPPAETQPAPPLPDEETVSGKIAARAEIRETQQSGAPQGAPKTPKMSRGMLRATVISAAALVLLAVGFCLLVAQPWVPPAEPEEIAEPHTVRLPDPLEMSVGETRAIEVPLGDNERVDAISTKDSDVASISDGAVTAVGEWQGAVITVRVKEKEAPVPETPEYRLLGIDLSEFRMKLRAFLGVEEKAAAREPVVTVIYEVIVNIEGYPADYGGPVNLYTLDKHELAIAGLLGGEEVLFTYDPAFVEITPEARETGTVYVVNSGNGLGRQQITAAIGFYKDGQFVVTRTVDYFVEVRLRAQSGGEVAFTEGVYNGLVPVLPEEQTPAA